MSLKSKILEFPKSREKRLEEAIRAYFERRFSDALSGLLRLIDEGADEAFYYAGCIYEEGGDGIEQDLAKAFFYYERSVECAYVEGYLALARLYRLGIGVPMDYQKAHKLLAPIADKANDGVGHAVAQMVLGQMYYYGHGVPQNTAIAREYFQKAASQEYVFAFSALSAIERHSGNYLRSIRLRIKAMWSAIRISWKDPHDHRLRRN